MAFSNQGWGTGVLIGTGVTLFWCRGCASNHCTNLCSCPGSSLRGIPTLQAVKSEVPPQNVPIAMACMVGPIAGFVFPGSYLSLFLFQHGLFCYFNQPIPKGSQSYASKLLLALPWPHETSLRVISETDSHFPAGPTRHSVKKRRERVNECSNSTVGIAAFHLKGVV